MAVRHGFGKVVTDGLVFAYDTKDIWNSYKGEPTDNLISLAGHDSEVERSGTNYPYFSANITSFVQSIWSPSNNVFTMSFEGKRDYVQGGTGGGGDGYPRMYVYFSDWSWSRSFGTGAYDWTYTSSTGAMPDPTGKNIYFAIYHMNSGNPGKSYSRKHQVEFKGHATPFINGSRSSTEGLLDLTGNKTIDLSGVSFDANAMIDFDGTDDFLVIPNVDLRPGFTLETVCYPESGTFAVWGQGPTIANRGLHIIATTGGRGFVYGMYGNDCDYQHFPTTNAWHHWVFTYDGTTFQKKFFADGVAQTPSGNAVQNEWIEAAGDLRLGTNYGSGTTYSKANGKIAVAKYYNRPLTDAEIQANFNHYKTRFNIA